MNDLESIAIDITLKYFILFYFFNYAYIKMCVYEIAHVNITTHNGQKRSLYLLEVES